MSKGKILLIDDEEEILVSVAMRLRAHGFEVLPFREGTEALKRAGLERPNLIILDIGLEEMSGHEVAAMLRKNQATKEIPIIYFTAHTSPKDYEKAKVSRIDRYITKPFRSEELLEAVKGLIQKPESRDLSGEICI